MGHYIPIVRIAKALELAGHRVTIFSNNYHRERCQQVRDINDIKGEVLFPDEKLGLDRDHYFDGRNKDMLHSVFPLNLDEEVVQTYADAFKAVNADIVVQDTCSLFGAAAAKKIGVPCVSHLALNLMCIELNKLLIPHHERTWRTPFGCLCVFLYWIDPLFDMWLN